MDTLPQEQREALVLRYFQSMTVPQIAAVVGTQDGTIKSRLYYGLAEIRTQLQDTI